MKKKKITVSEDYICLSETVNKLRTHQTTGGKPPSLYSSQQPSIEIDLPFNINIERFHKIVRDNIRDNKKDRIVKDRILLQFSNYSPIDEPLPDCYKELVETGNRLKITIEGKQFEFYVTGSDDFISTTPTSSGGLEHSHCLFVTGESLLC